MSRLSMNERLHSIHNCETLTEEVHAHEEYFMTASMEHDHQYPEKHPSMFYKYFIPVAG